MRIISEKELWLLSHFRQNARESLTKISRNTKVPVSTIFDKLKHYEGNLIKKHTTILDFTKLGFLAKAQAMLQLSPSQREEAKEFLLKCDNVNSLYKINNGYDYLIEFIFRDMRELEDFIGEFEKKFDVRKKQLFYIVDEIQRENFMANPELMKININN